MAAAVVVMGVAGSGKSTLGRRLAKRLGFAFEDADTYHPPANVAKMASGVPLDDDDRRPWLERLQRLLREELTAGRSVVLACSALKAAYREVLAAAGTPQAPVHFVYLRGDYDTLLARMRRRRGHYMKAGMLASQFRDLEEPDHAVTVEVGLDIGASLRHALDGLAARGVRPSPRRTRSSRGGRTAANRSRSAAPPGTGPTERGPTERGPTERGPTDPDANEEETA